MRVIFFFSIKFSVSLSCRKKILSWHPRRTDATTTESRIPTTPRLVSIYSGFPRFPKLCHGAPGSRARSAPPVCIILYLFRLVKPSRPHPRAHQNSQPLTSLYSVDTGIHPSIFSNTYIRIKIYVYIGKPKIGYIRVTWENLLGRIPIQIEQFCYVDIGTSIARNIINDWKWRKMFLYKSHFSFYINNKLI